MDTPPQPFTKDQLLSAGGILAVALVVIVFFAFSLGSPEELAILDEAEKEAGLEVYAIDPVFGPPQAKVTIVEFADFACEHCAKNYPIMKEITKLYPKDVRVVWKGISGTGSDSRSMHRAALCAHLQGRFWEYHDVLFSSPNEPKTQTFFSSAAARVGLDTSAFQLCLTNNQEIDQLLNRNTIMAGALSVNELPTFFINNIYRTSGVLSIDAWKKELKGLLP